MEIENYSDYLLYENREDMHNPHYNWTTLHTLLPFDSKVVSGDEPIDTKLFKQYYPIFCHEYIHYLQNFYTAWGTTVFADYTTALAKLGSAKAIAAYNESFLVPITAVNFPANSMFRDGWDMKTLVIAKLSKGDSHSSVNQIHDAIILSKGEFLYHDFQLQPGLKCIREHMAHMGSLTAIGYTDKGIDSFNKAHAPFLKDGVLYNHTIYWIMFQYFFGLQQYQNVGIGIFFLCYECLGSLNPEKALNRFLVWIETGKQESLSGDFKEVVELWHQSRIEKISRNFSKIKAIKHLKKTVELSTKGDNDLLKASGFLAQYSIDNLQRPLFQRADSINSLSYWHALMSRTGTGILRFKDRTLLMGRTGVNADFEQCFLNIFASSMAVQTLEKGFYHPCPFYSQVPICAASMKGEQCIVNPYKVTAVDEKGGSCLYRSGILLLGIEDKLSET
jgi:hypothetical protein